MLKREPYFNQSKKPALERAKGNWKGLQLPVAGIGLFDMPKAA